MKYRWAVMVCAFALVCGVGWMTFADVGDYPLIWTWDPPIGDADNSTEFPDMHWKVTGITRVWNTTIATDPRTCAKDVADSIRAEGLQDGQVGSCLD